MHLTARAASSRQLLLAALRAGLLAGLGLLVILAPNLALVIWLHGGHATPEQAALHAALHLRYGDRDHHHLTAPDAQPAAGQGVGQALAGEGELPLAPAVPLLSAASDLPGVIFSLAQGCLPPSVAVLLLALALAGHPRPEGLRLRSAFVTLDPPPPRPPLPY